MTDNQQPDSTGYNESNDHVPDPTAMSGTLETSGTGGGRHAHLSGVSRVFGNVEAFIGQVEEVARGKMNELVDEVRGIVHREEAASQVQPVTQQTTQDGAVPVHEGDIVQNDGTGQPAPATIPAQETPADQTQTGTTETSNEGEANPENDKPKQGTLTDGPSPALRRPAKKAAANPANGAAKK